MPRASLVYVSDKRILRMGKKTIMNTESESVVVTQRKKGKPFSGPAWIAAGFVLIVLIRAIFRPATSDVPQEAGASGSGTDAYASSELPANASDLLDRYAPDADFIEPAALQAIREHPSVFQVDIRTPREWQAGRIPGAVLIPLQELGQRLHEIPRDRHVILYCRTASRTRQGLRILRNAGFSSVRHLRGGILAWTGPVETEPTHESP